MTYELLAPAGDLATARIALRYGADAVYLGGPALQLRAKKSPSRWRTFAAPQGKPTARIAKYTSPSTPLPGMKNWKRSPPMPCNCRTRRVDGVIIADPGRCAAFIRPRRRCPFT